MSFTPLNGNTSILQLHLSMFEKYYFYLANKCPGKAASGADENVLVSLQNVNDSAGKGAENIFVSRTMSPDDLCCFYATPCRSRSAEIPSLKIMKSVQEANYPPQTASLKMAPCDR